LKMKIKAEAEADDAHALQMEVVRLLSSLIVCHRGAALSWFGATSTMSTATTAATEAAVAATRTGRGVEETEEAEEEEEEEEEEEGVKAKAAWLCPRLIVLLDAMGRAQLALDRRTPGSRSRSQQSQQSQQSRHSQRSQSASSQQSSSSSSSASASAAGSAGSRDKHGKGVREGGKGGSASFAVDRLSVVQQRADDFGEAFELLRVLISKRGGLLGELRQTGSTHAFRSLLLRLERGDFGRSLHAVVNHAQELRKLYFPI